MADIALRVELYKPSATVGKIVGIQLTNSAKVANTSFQIDSSEYNYYTKIPTERFNGSNGLVWADEDVLTFNDADELDNVVKSGGFVEDEQDPDEFFWGLTDANGNYEVRLNITGRSYRPFQYITVFGDVVNQQFPTEAYVNGSKTPIYSDDAQWVINCGFESAGHSITFTKWNRPNYNAAITLIRVTATSYDLTPFNGLSDVSVHLQSNTNPQELEYGVVPNSGSFSMTDEGGEVEDLIREGMLPISNLPIDYYLNGNRKSRHITTDSDYSTDRTASASMTNNISNWGNIQFQGRAYTGTTTTMYKILFDVLNSTVFNGALTDTVFAGLFDHTSTSERLKSITTTYDYVEPNTLRQTIDNICNVGQITCYEVATADYPNNIRFANARPVYYAGQALYLVPERYQIEQPSKDIVLRNQYDGVEIQECQVKDEVISRTNVYNLKTNGTATGSPTFVTQADIYESTVSGGGITTYGYNYAGVVLGYNTKELSITIPKKSNFNLNEVRDVYGGVDASGNANITYSVIYTKTEMQNVNYTFTYQTNPRQDLLDFSGGTKGIVAEDSGQLPNLSISAQYSTGLVTVSASIDKGESSNVKTVKVQKNTDSYTISGLQIVVYEYRGSVSGATGSYPSRPSSFTIQAPAEIYKATQVEISFLGDKRTITFDDFEAKQSPNFATAKTIARIDENQLLTDRLNYTGSTAGYTATLMNNILTDYKDGIATAKVKVFCGDVYNTGGLKVRDWTKGETYEIGDLVQVDNDNEGHSEWTYQNGDSIVWKVTGLTHSYSGAPYIDLELQEVKPLT